jgi:hypothetical protein
MVMLTCFRFLAICCFHVNLLPIVIPRYLIYVYDYKTKFCRQQSEVIKIIRMTIFAAQERPKSDKENIGGLDVAEIKLTTCQVTKLPL